MNLKKVTKDMEIVAGTDKVGGNPTYLPNDEDREIVDDFCFLMEIYNNDRINGKEGVLCWQLYQGGEFGGPIEEVVEIPIGAKKNINNEIPKRRWLDEYIIEYEEKEERGYDEEEEDYDSKIGGISNIYMNNEIESEGATFLGEMYTLDEYDDVCFGYAPVTLVLNKNRELEVW